MLLLAAAFALFLGIYLIGPSKPPGHGLGLRIANRIACGPREPGVCRQHPTVSAYGWDLARAVRALAPVPVEVGSPAGALVPVDFRYCQKPGCAVSSGDGRLTSHNRRLTLFTEIRPISRGSWEIIYWSYRPSLGWASTVRKAGPQQIAAASGTRVLLSDSPRLVPLEILPGRNHYDLPPGDEPPWRWKIESVHPGWSA